MAIFHLTHSFVRRSNGSSSIATAAYNSGQKLEDNQGSSAYSDYTRKGGILYDEICLPAGSPAWADNRGELWRRLEAREDRSTRPRQAVLAHNFNIALPHELTLEQNIFLARDFVREQFTRKLRLKRMSGFLFGAGYTGENDGWTHGNTSWLK